MSIFITSSLVFRAISNAIGGRDWFQALQALSPWSSVPSSAMARPSSLASIRRSLQLDSFFRIGSPWDFSVLLPVEDMAFSVAEIT
jgi:hypothetical protein